MQHKFVPIETERLTLRALAEADFDHIFEILSDEATTKHVSWRETTRRDARAWLQRRMTDERNFGLSM